MILLPGMKWNYNEDGKYMYTAVEEWTQYNHHDNSDWICRASLDNPHQSPRPQFKKNYIICHLILDQFQLGLATAQDLEQFEQLTSKRISQIDGGMHPDARRHLLERREKIIQNRKKFIKSGNRY